jgi:hypothetical protein
MNAAKNIVGQDSWNKMNEEEKLNVTKYLIRKGKIEGGREEYQYDSYPYSRGGQVTKFQQASDYWKQLESRMTPKQKKFFNDLLNRRRDAFERNMNDSDISSYINGEIEEQFGVDLGIRKYDVSGQNWFKLGFKFIAYRESIEHPEFWEGQEMAKGGRVRFQDKISNR